MKIKLIIVGGIFLLATSLFGQKNIEIINGYYTRLPFDDQGFTGKFADIVVDIPAKGKFVFSREYSYQPYWQPTSGKKFLVDRLIPRIGDGPVQRPDRNNICSNAAIVNTTSTSMTVHWRYAPDMTKPSFIDFREAYNKAGNPSEFYTEYADEYFIINADATILREAKIGCYSLENWNDPKNQFTQKLRLSPDGIIQTSLTAPRLQRLSKAAIQGESVKVSTISGAILNFSFDVISGKNEQQTIEHISKTKCPIKGPKAYWSKGVSGTCLSFDSYSNAVVLASAKCPVVNDEFSIEAWVAPQEYPFNLAAIIDHLNGDNGYLLGMNAKGEIEFKVGINSNLVTVISKSVPLYKWTQIVATYSKTNGLNIFLNGVLSVSRPVPGEFTDADNTDISIGMTRSCKQFPAGAERDITKSFATNMVFSGLIDEVKIFGRNITGKEIKHQYETFKPFNDQPLQAWLLPDSPKNPAGFGAMYTNLKYSFEWDGLWRVGNYSDIVVTFEDQPWRFVFWRGTRYLPSLVTDYGKDGIWSSDQSPEHYSGQCFEHMSDMLCRFSNIRLISSTPARVIVHWRNSSASIGYNWPKIDENGWGIWTDEYWTIYPDGVSVRNQLLHNGIGANIIEMNQNEILHHPGQTTNDVMLNDALTIGNEKGETQTWSRLNPNPDNSLEGNKNLQYINLNSPAKQFQIGEIGTRIDIDIKKDVWWNGWNHYPTQLIPSDGTQIFQYDRPASSCVATFREVRHQLNKNNVEAMNLYGLTQAKPKELASLNRSWNFAPEIKDETGCLFLGFKKGEKAYYIIKNAGHIKFKIAATKESPLVNPAFVIKNWVKSNADDLEIKINGQVISNKKEYQKGIETDTDGTRMLVLWIKYSAEETTNLELKSN